MSRPEHPSLDAMDLDGRALQLLVAVVEEASVTRAAERLALTQSAVSHQLERLRQLTGDALVVRSGRGVAPTAHALALAEQARALLQGLRALARPVAFDPSSCQATLLIAANPLQRDLLLPALLQRLQSEAPGVSLRVVNSGAPTAAMLRDPAMRLVITPRPPPEDDGVHELLFEDRYAVFFDAAVREAPATRTAFEAAEHVVVRYEDGRGMEIDRFLAERGLKRRIVAQLPDITGIAPFVRGTARLATMPTLTATHQMQGLAQAPVPLPCPPMPMHMAWHRRWSADPMHQWLRGALREVAARIAQPASR